MVLLRMCSNKSLKSSLSRVLRKVIFKCHKIRFQSCVALSQISDKRLFLANFFTYEDNIKKIIAK